MGTNYYQLEPNPDYYEETLASLTEPKYLQKHIGKSSAGWVFSLHVIPEEGLVSLAAWKRRWNKILDSGEKLLLVNEYGESITLKELLSVITERESDISWESHEEHVLHSSFFAHESFMDYLDSNSAVKGPNNLLRHRIDGKYCTGHGKGTWDYIEGWFR